LRERPGTTALDHPRTPQWKGRSAVRLFRAAAAGTLGIVGGILLFAWLVASFVLDLLAVYLTFGGLGVLLGIVLAPIVFVIAPWCAGLAHGFWWPLIVEYGGLVVLGLVFGLAEKLFSTRE
jgi:hypothetical protein